MFGTSPDDSGWQRMSCTRCCTWLDSSNTLGNMLGNKLGNKLGNVLRPYAFEAVRAKWAFDSAESNGIHWYGIGSIFSRKFETILERCFVYISLCWKRDDVQGVGAGNCSISFCKDEARGRHSCAVKSYHDTLKDYTQTLSYLFRVAGSKFVQVCGCQSSDRAWFFIMYIEFDWSCPNPKQNLSDCPNCDFCLPVTPVEGSSIHTCRLNSLAWNRNQFRM